MHILIVIFKGKVEDVMCCADGSDRSHLLTQGKDYCVLDLDKIEKADWLHPNRILPRRKKSLTQVVNLPVAKSYTLGKRSLITIPIIGGFFKPYKRVSSSHVVCFSLEQHQD